MLIRITCAIKEQPVQTELEKRLSHLDVHPVFITRPQKAWQELVRSCADIFIISTPLIPRPVESSIAILNTLPEKPITIALHDKDSSEAFASLMASGIDMVLFSGISPESLCEAIESTIESRRQLDFLERFDQRGRFQPRLNDFVSNSREMQVFLDETRQVVSSDATLLLLGETGVGKEHLSKALHAESHRSAGPFIALNMAALPEQLMESELFGHEQGAFTGAVRSRRGAFEMAHGGTLFLDEIGEMPLQVQTKLLRVLQDLEFTPVGGEKPIWVDVRIIAATNKDLEDEIRHNRFRKDLYYRLSVITLTLPPLRKRKEDIVSLAKHFLSLSNKKMGRDITGFANDTLSALCHYEWPGNIRELMNVIERSVLLCKSDNILISDLPEALHQTKSVPGKIQDAELIDRQNWEGKTLPEVRQMVLEKVESAYLSNVLSKTHGNIAETARIAGIHPRGLYGKMQQYQLNKAHYRVKPSPKK